jgi:hypothetical protein
MRLLVFVALCLPAWNGLFAVPVRFQATLAAPKGAEDRTVVVRLIPQKAAAAPEPLSASLLVPGEAVLDVPGGSSWQVLTEAAGLWSAPQWIASVSGAPEQVVLLKLFPSAKVTGVLKRVAGKSTPSTIDLRLEASPGASPQVKLPATTLQCPVRSERFECAVPAAKLDLQVRVSGYVPVYRWDVDVRRVEGKDSADLGVFPLKAGASVAGWVRGIDAKGVAGALVRLEPQRTGLPSDPARAAGLKAMALESKTNDRGFFQLAEAVPGMAAVSATKEGFARVQRAGIEIRPELEAQILDPLILTSPLALRVTLEPPVSPSASPWQVTVERRDADEILPEGPVFRGVASLEGIWEQQGLDSGRYVVSVKDGETAFLSEAVELAPERTAFHFSLPGVRIVGHVRIGKEPLEATVLFVGKSAMRRARFESDPKGNFAGLLPDEGTWNVDLVSEKAGLKLKLDPMEVRKPAGKSYATVEIMVPDTRLRGRVVDERGNAVPRASVLFSHPGKRPSGVSTDTAGEFEARGLAPGPTFVFAEEGNRETERLLTQVEEERDAPELQLVLRTRFTVQGRVTSPRGPVAGARILAVAPLNEAGAAGGGEAFTGPAGEFTVQLPGGTQLIHLSVVAPGYPIRMLVVLLGVEPVVEIPLELVGGTLIFDLGNRTLDEVLGAGAGLLAHAGSFVPIGGAVRWARLLRAEQRDPHRLVLPNMEAGDYMLCLGAEAQAAVPRGKEPPAVQCSQGTLAPLQELVLPLPQSRKNEENLRPASDLSSS